MAFKKLRLPPANPTLSVEVYLVPRGYQITIHDHANGVRHDDCRDYPDNHKVPVLAAKVAEAIRAAIKAVR